MWRFSALLDAKIQQNLLISKLQFFRTGQIDEIVDKIATLYLAFSLVLNFFVAKHGIILLKSQLLLYFFVFLQYE